MIKIIENEKKQKITLVKIFADIFYVSIIQIIITNAKLKYEK